MALRLQQCAAPERCASARPRAPGAGGAGAQRWLPRRHRAAGVCADLHRAGAAPAPGGRDGTATGWSAALSDALGRWHCCRPAWRRWRGQGRSSGSSASLAWGSRACWQSFRASRLAGQAVTSVRRALPALWAGNPVSPCDVVPTALWAPCHGTRRRRPSPSPCTAVCRRPGCTQRRAPRCCSSSWRCPWRTPPHPAPPRRTVGR